MKKFHIGLDFGTYQSKACIYDLENDTHEFFRFPNNTFFLPSIVSKKFDGKFEYGNTIDRAVEEEYCYFKIAAAEDEEFNSESFGANGIKNFYEFNEFKNYTPEFLSVIYITYIILLIKEKYRQFLQVQTKSEESLPRILQNPTKQYEVKFTIQLGIPTEWSQLKNLRRKRKFENILILSESLQKEYKNKDTFLAASAEQLLKNVYDIYQIYNFSNKDDYENHLNELGISVYPETAAGLTFIVKTKQLLAGYYAIMDIGGGSTDISFFCIQPDGNIRYFASESYMIAANNVYKKYNNNSNSLILLKKAETIIRKKIESNKWAQDNTLRSALEEIDKNLCKVVYRLFNKRVYWFNNSMIENYSNQPIILYGGGSRLPILNSGEILIHDNGSPYSPTIPLTNIEKQEMKKYASIVNIRPTDGRWESDFPLLAVALGLSFIKPASSADWFNDHDYNSKDGGQQNIVPHPFNEGCYIYDVLNSKWR